MLTPSLILIVLGTVMVPGGAFVPQHMAVGLIGSGTLLLIAGVGVGFAPVRWTELSLPGLKGQIESSDGEFKRLYRQHRERLHDFATLMSGDGALATTALRDAAARTRLDWQLGAASEPLAFMLRSLLKELERPGLGALLRGPAKARRHRERPEHARHRPQTLTALAELPFPRRAAFLLDALFSLSHVQIAELTGRTEEQVGEDVEAAIAHLGPLLTRPGEEQHARR